MKSGIYQIRNLSNENIYIGQKWLDMKKPNYNSCPTAGSSLGWKHSVETKNKLSLLNSGNKKYKTVL
jgi:hypothetical protein